MYEYNYKYKYIDTNNMENLIVFKENKVKIVWNNSFFMCLVLIDFLTIFKSPLWSIFIDWTNALSQAWFISKTVLKINYYWFKNNLAKFFFETLNTIFSEISSAWQIPLSFVFKHCIVYSKQDPTNKSLSISPLLSNRVIAWPAASTIGLLGLSKRRSFTKESTSNFANPESPANVSLMMFSANNFWTSWPSLR